MRSYDRPMSDPGAPVTYRYVSDDQMPSALNRDSMARARLPVAGLARFSRGDR